MTRITDIFWSVALVDIFQLRVCLISSVSQDLIGTYLIEYVYTHADRKVKHSRPGLYNTVPYTSSSSSSLSLFYVLFHANMGRAVNCWCFFSMHDDLKQIFFPSKELASHPGELATQQRSVLLKASSGERHAPCNFLLLVTLLNIEMNIKINSGIAVSSVLFPFFDSIIRSWERHHLFFEWQWGVKDS